MSRDVYMYYKFNGVKLFLCFLIGFFIYIISFSELSQREGLSKNQKRVRAMHAKKQRARAQAQAQARAQAQTQARAQAEILQKKNDEDNDYFDGLNQKIVNCFEGIRRDANGKISETDRSTSGCVKMHADTVREISKLKSNLNDKVNKLNSVSDLIDNELTYIDSIVSSDP